MSVKHFFYLSSFIFVFVGCKPNATNKNLQTKILASKKRAVSYAAEKKYDLAVLSIDSTISVQPNNIELYTTKFNILLRSKKYTEGLEVLEQMHKIEPNNAEAFSFQGYINEKFGNDSLALIYYNKGLKACKYRADKKVEEFKNKVNIAFLKHFTESKAASMAYIDSLAVRHAGNGFIQDQKDFIKNFDKEEFLEAL